MYHPNKPVWELVGMDVYSYKSLPIKEKKLMMRRAGYPFAIYDTCTDCGAFLGTGIPENWAERLIDAYSVEMGRRIYFMGRKAAQESWKY